MNYRLSGFLLASIVLAGCADPKQVADGTTKRSDPLNSFNRTMFNFNYQVLDPYILRPVAVAWKGYVPAPARSGLSNALSNLDEPSSMVNYLLAGKFTEAAKHFTRFMLNTTLGLGGFIDVASKANPKLARQQAYGLGSTLGYYGVGYGPYVQLPAYGSFTLRQDGGDLVDMAYPPLSWLTFWLSAGKWMLQGVEGRAQLLDSDGLLHQQSDPYSFIRNAYFQHYDFLAKGGQLKPEDNPNAQAIQGDLSEIDRN